MISADEGKLVPRQRPDHCPRSPDRRPAPEWVAPAARHPAAPAPRPVTDGGTAERHAKAPAQTQEGRQPARPRPPQAAGYPAIQRKARPERPESRSIVARRRVTDALPKAPPMSAARANGCAASLRVCRFLPSVCCQTLRRAEWHGSVTTIQGCYPASEFRQSSVCAG